MFLFGSRYHFNRHLAPEIRKTHWERRCVAVTEWFASVSFWHFKMLSEQKTPAGNMLSRHWAVSDSPVSPRGARPTRVLSQVWLGHHGLSFPGCSVHAILRQERCSGLLCLLEGMFPAQGLNPSLFTSPALAGGFFTTSAAQVAWVSAKSMHEKLVPWSVCCAVGAHGVSWVQAAFVLFSSQLYSSNWRLKLDIPKGLVVCGLLEAFKVLISTVIWQLTSCFMQW